MVRVREVLKDISELLLIIYDNYSLDDDADNYIESKLYDITNKF